MTSSTKMRLANNLRAGMAMLCMFAAPMMPAIAKADPVVVELYTSQGCSSCPPADEMLARLAGRDDVIALGLHVDYWDYIGWADIFANPHFTERQRGYARAKGERMIYTPQMVIGGRDHVIGSKPADVEAAIKSQKNRNSPVTLVTTRRGEVLEIEAKSESVSEMVVHLATFRPAQEVHIKRGENAGRNIVYANVVTDWHEIQKWDGAHPMKVKLRLASADPVAVIVQRAKFGPILAAAKLD